MESFKKFLRVSTIHQTILSPLFSSLFFFFFFFDSFYLYESIQNEKYLKDLLVVVGRNLIETIEFYFIIKYVSRFIWKIDCFNL